MAAATQTPSANYSPHPCSKCGDKQLQRKARKAPHKIFGIYPYRCVHCGHHEQKVRLKPGLVVRWGLMVATPAVAAWFWFHPLSLHRDDGLGGSAANADALARARTTAGGLSTFEQMMIKKPRTTMDNATILKLWKANVGTNVILQLIRTSTADYDVSASSIIELKEAGVDQTVILAMIDASYANR